MYVISGDRDIITCVIYELRLHYVWHMNEIDDIIQKCNNLSLSTRQFVQLRILL